MERPSGFSEKNGDAPSRAFHDEVGGFFGASNWEVLPSGDQIIRCEAFSLYASTPSGIPTPRECISDTCRSGRIIHGQPVTLGDRGAQADMRHRARFLDREPMGVSDSQALQRSARPL